VYQVEIVPEGEDAESAEGAAGSAAAGRLMRPGEVFACRAMLTKSTHRLSTRAHQHVELLALSHADLSQLLRSFPDIRQAVYLYALFNYQYSFQL